MSVWGALRNLVARKSVEADLEDELQFHREQQFAKLRKAADVTEEDARRRVFLEFGGSEQIKEECREARSTWHFENFLRDLRYGLRNLRQSPGFTAAALLTLALGIGANTAVFSVLYGVLLRPLPYPNASRLTVLQETTPKVGTVSVSYPNFEDWRAQARSFSEMAFVAKVDYNITGTDHPASVTGEAVTPNVLSMLGVHISLGRPFNAAEKAPVVLISYALWRARFHGQRDAIGQTIGFDWQPYTIIGVLPPDYRWTEKADFLEPLSAVLATNPDYKDRAERSNAIVLGELRKGLTIRQAQVEMQAIAGRLAIAYPKADDQFGVSLQPIREVFAGEVRPVLLVLFVAAILVLLIACSNVGNLLLLRGITRTKEISLRLALGATNARIALQMMTESLLLTTLGGAAGLTVAALAIRGATKLIPEDTFRGADIHLNAPALGFAVVVVVLSALAFGLAPALRSQLDLKKWARTNSWRDVLAASEVSLALLLMIGAGLMTKSLYRLLAVDPGVRTEHMLTIDLSLGSQYKDDAARLKFWTKLLERVRSFPGIEAAAMGTNVPLTGNHWRSDVMIEGMPTPKPGSFPHPDIHIVTPGFVEALGVHLLRGRTFNDFDSEKGDLVALLNARMARQYYGTTDPIGKRIRLDEKWRTIVGVAGDTKMYGLANPSRPELYVPFRQMPTDWMTLVVRSVADPELVKDQVRKAIAGLDSNLPVNEMPTLEELVQSSLWTQHTAFVLLGCFSAIALLLSAFGIYGTISYSAAQRAVEIGIRMALGAQRIDVLRLILAQGARLVLFGGGIGLALSLGLTRLMSKLLYMVSPLDPATFVLVTIALLATALLATYIPALRTTHVDPVNTLRCE